MFYEYQKHSGFFAVVAGGMEELLAEELNELGAKNVVAGYRGVTFKGDQRILYKVNYESRLATRILAPLFTFDCHSARYLQSTAKKIKWDDFLDTDDTFAITASVSDTAGFTNSLYAAQCLKDAICDWFRDKTGERPSVDIKNPDVRFNLHIRKNKAVISLDTSGEALHKRGYRKSSVFAPMQETLAAAIIRNTGWDGETPLWDFMCGSGTLLAEAHMKYCRIPSQYLRMLFGFFNLPDFDRKIWSEVQEESNGKIRPLPEGLIIGSDKDQDAIDSARENLACLPGSESIALKWRPFRSAANFENGTIVCNPPYGIRLGERDEAAMLYREIGDFLKKSCNGTAAYIYTGDKTLVKEFRLKPSKRFNLVNGNLDGVLVEIKSFKVKYFEFGVTPLPGEEPNESTETPEVAPESEL